MRLSRTVFEILSLIFQKLKRSRDSDHVPFRDVLSSVGLDLLCSTHIIKFEMSTITCNEEIKGNAICKNFRFEPPYGDLRVTCMVHLWLAEKRVVDFLLVLKELFSLALMAAALLSEICRNHRFLKGWVTLSANCW